MRPSLAERAKRWFRAAYAHVTLNKMTTTFFLFSLVHCFAQGTIQAFIFTLDANYSTFLHDITFTAGIPLNHTVPYRRGAIGNQHLQSCSDIPWGLKTSPCVDIFKSGVDTNGPLLDLGLRQTIVADNLYKRLKVAARTNETTNLVDGVNLISAQGSVFLDSQCTSILLYPSQLLRNYKREAATLILLQFWLFVVSLLAVMHHSVPHTLAVLGARMTITAWSAYSIWRSSHFEGVFKEMIQNSGTPCSLNLFPSYFQTRIAYEIPDLILNITALTCSCYISWTLLRLFNATSFNRVGAPEHLNRIHKIFVAVLACLQLEAFVLTTAMGLWIDVLRNTAIAQFSLFTKIYSAGIIFTIICILPWISMGWYAIRKERRILMALYFSCGFVLLTGWSWMFYSIVYRWTFIQWPFFACFAVAAIILIVASMILSVISYMNFNKGLAQYYRAEDALASSDFTQEVFPQTSKDEEKGWDDPTDILPRLSNMELPPPTYSSTTPGVVVLSRQHLRHSKEAPRTVVYTVPLNAPF